MNANTGAWIDAQPLLLPRETGAQLATNGSDALAVTIGYCSTGIDRCLVTTRIPMSTAAPDAPRIGLAASRNASRLAVGSDGSDYLAACTEVINILS